MWKLLEEGEEVHAIVTGGYNADGDYRLAFLRSYERFHLVTIRGVAGERRRVSYALRDNLAAAVLYIRRHRVQLVAVEWGGGPPPGLDRPFFRACLGAIRSEVKRLARNRGRPNPWLTRDDFMVAAKLLRRSLVCLPHGLNVKLDAMTTTESEILRKGPYPWYDRNRFDVHVLNTEEHRQWHLDHAVGDANVMQTWGSARWDSTWFEVNRRIAPPFEWPEQGRGCLKVVFMVPKWEKRVDADAVVELVQALQSLEFASIAIKQHPRPEDGSAEPLRKNPHVDWRLIHDVSSVDSVPLIEAADVIVDVGSSIGIEVLMQEKVLVNPTYLHALTTFFDDIPGVCVVASTTAQVVDYLGAHARGERFEVDPAAYEQLLQRAVYGSQLKRFDVLDLYYRRLTELARESGGTARTRATVFARS